MKIPQLLGILLLLASSTAAILGWKAAAFQRADNERLQLELQRLREHGVQESTAAADQQARELKVAQANGAELIRLRGEVAQLRSTAREAEAVRAENQRLRSEQEARRTASNVTTGSSADTPAPARDHFPRESWSFAGYASPEASLMSAIWAMKEGNPKSYLESLSPEEQARLTKAWENKSETEVAAKHQEDVLPIAGVRILERQSVGADEVVMNVYLDGLGRMEKVSMKRFGNDWKFNGYVPAPPKK